MTDAAWIQYLDEEIERLQKLRRDTLREIKVLEKMKKEMESYDERKTISSKGS